MKKFDVSWLIDAADTNEKRANLSVILASAALGDSFVSDSEPRAQIRRLYAERLEHYSELCARMQERLDNET
jgi:hypothetical protein